MRNHVRAGRADHNRSWYEDAGAAAEREFALTVLGEGADGEDADDALDDAADGVRVFCPDCRQPITVFADDERLPGHALCPTPWNPFGLTVCSGSGRPVGDARAVDTPGADAQPDLAVLLTLPAGLDWRTQPFSHATTARPLRHHAA